MRFCAWGREPISSNAIDGNLWHSTRGRLFRGHFDDAEEAGGRVRGKGDGDGGFGLGRGFRQQDAAPLDRRREPPLPPIFAFIDHLRQSFGPAATTATRPLRVLPCLRKTDREKRPPSPTPLPIWWRLPSPE